MRRNSGSACCTGMAWAGRGIVRCKKSRQFSFVQKRTALYGFCPVKQSFLCIMISWSSYLPVSRKLARCATVSVGNERGSCRLPLRLSCEKAVQPSPRAWLNCKIKIQFLKLCAERSGAHLKSFKSAVTPALPAIPAHSRCSGTCRWSSAQRSGRIPLQCWRCSGGSCTAQCSPDAWGAWAAPCGQPCHSQ